MPLRAVAPAEARSLGAAPPGIPPAALGTLAEHGVLHESGGTVVVCGRADDPLTGTADLYVTADASVLARAAELDRLLGSIVAAFGAPDRIIARTPCDRRPADPRFALLMRCVRTRAAPGAPAGAHGVRLVAGDDVAFVHELLAAATVSGYRAAGYAVPRAAALAYVERAYGSFAPDGPVAAVVATAEGRPVGHATWRCDGVDEITGEVYGELVDVSVLDGHQGRGVSRALSDHAVRSVTARGLPVRATIIAEAGAPDSELERALAGGGWAPLYDLWVLDRWRGR